MAAKAANRKEAIITAEEKTPERYIPNIPDHIRMEIARCLLPDIVAYYNSEKGQREYAEWKATQGENTEL